MSVINKLNTLSKEIFEEEFNALNDYEQKLIINIYELDEIIFHTDLITN